VTQDFILSRTGAPYDTLILNTPPQHGKSLTITETLPAWYLLRHPAGRVIVISYSEDFAKLFGRRNREKLMEIGPVFGVKVAKSPSSATEFEIEGQKGGMISRGLLSGVTGRPADLMIIDDPLKTRKEADSETIRRSIIGEWLSSYRTRLAPGAKVILIQTRWHEEDLAGWMAANEPGAVRINLPCEAEAGDPLGRAIGEPLCPEIGKDADWLCAFKAGYQREEGARAWNALFQGRPTSMEGNLIRREWWQYYDGIPKINREIISVDAAFKGKENSDFVAIQAWGKTGPNCYLLDAVKKRLDFPDTLRELRAFIAAHPGARGIYIEDKANGPAIISMLQKEIPGVIAVNPDGGKVARVNAVSPAIEAGNVYLPRNAPFTGDFVESCAAFPHGANDDDVDCMSQALDKLLYHPARGKTRDKDHQVDDFLSYRG